MKKFLWLIIAVVIIVAAVFIFQNYRSQRAQAAQADLQTTAIERGELTATVGATGVVRANQTALLTWATTGTVDEALIEVGEQVEAGQVLATLQETSLPQNVILARSELLSAQKALEDLQDTALALAQTEQAVAQAEEAVRESEDALEILRRSTPQSQIDLAEAQVEITRQQLETAQDRYEPYADTDPDNLVRSRLLATLVEAEQAYEDAQDRLETLQSGPSESTLELARANLALAQEQLGKANKSLEEVRSGPDADQMATLQNRIAAAEATLKLARLEAPFSGKISQSPLKPGDLVAPGMQAIRLDDLSRLLVDVQISEVDINRIEVGQPVRLSFDAILNQEYQGEVIQVALVGTTVQGVVDFTVTVELTNPDDAVRPGMTAAVNIVVRQLEDVLLVPNRAVRVVEGQRVVYIQEGEDIQTVEVTLGASSETHSEVLEGDLQVGDLVILNPPTTFSQDGPPDFVRR